MQCFGDEHVTSADATALIVVCERSFLSGNAFVLRSLQLPCSQSAWDDHVQMCKGLLHHLAEWVRAGLMPWDSKFDNLGRDVQGKWLTVDFDVFTEFSRKDTAKSIGKEWWAALKRVIKDYQSLTDKVQDVEWRRRTAMLSNSALLWKDYFGPGSAVYSDRPLLDVLLGLLYCLYLYLPHHVFSSVTPVSSLFCMRH